MPEPVRMKFILGSHVLTMQDATGEERPGILLSWSEALLMANLFTLPPGATCPVPINECLPCGLREELLAMIKLRGPGGPEHVRH